MEESTACPPKTIESLPAETVLHICRYLSQKDVASFRLTSKCHAECGQERLVEELHLMFRPKSFQNLLRIAQHPIFPKYVRSIFYEAAIAHFLIDRDIWSHHATYWSKHGTYEKKRPEPPAEKSLSRSAFAKWEKEAQHFDLWEGKKPKYSKKKLLEGWSAFNHIQEEAGKISESSEDFKAIFVAFSKFPNLAEIKMHTDCKATETMLKNYKKALFLPTDDIIPAITPDEERGFHSGTRQLSSVLEASVAAGVKLKSLSASLLDWSFFGDEPILYPEVEDDRRFIFESDFWAKPYEKRLEPAFHNLQHLDLHFENLFMDEELDLTVIEDRHSLLGSALKSAQQLRSLVLNFGDVEWNDYYEGNSFEAISLSRLMGGAPTDKVLWPHLRFLELHSVGATEKEWTTFFQTNAPTLQTLYLSSLCLKGIEDEDFEETESPHWKTYLLDLRQILDRKHIEFHGVFYIEEDFVEEGFDGVDEGWIDMDHVIPLRYNSDEHEGSVKMKNLRFGKLLQEWFIDDIGTKNNPITKYGRLFERYDELDGAYDDEDDEDEDDEDDFPFVGGFPGSLAGGFPFPFNPQMLAQMMAYAAAHPTESPGASDGESDDEMPPLI